MILIVRIYTIFVHENTTSKVFAYLQVHYALHQKRTYINIFIKDDTAHGRSYNKEIIIINGNTFSNLLYQF